MSKTLVFGTAAAAGTAVALALIRPQGMRDARDPRKLDGPSVLASCAAAFAAGMLVGHLVLKGGDASEGAEIVATANADKEAQEYLEALQQQYATRAPPGYEAGTPSVESSVASSSVPKSRASRTPSATSELSAEDALTSVSRGTREAPVMSPVLPPRSASVAASTRSVQQAGAQPAPRTPASSVLSARDW